MLTGMSLELLGIVAVLLAPVVLFGAALRWGVDSRFLDVRSDF
jgi:hypothetical protein